MICSFVFVCASPGPCALVCPRLPRSCSCVLVQAPVCSRLACPGPCVRVCLVRARVCLCALVPARVSACFARSCSCVLAPASACSCVHRILRVWKALGCEAESMRKIASWSSQWSPHWLNLSYFTCLEGFGMRSGVDAKDCGLVTPLVTPLAQTIVFYVFGRLWDAKRCRCERLRAGHPAGHPTCSPRWSPR